MGIFASSQASEREVSYEPSTSHINEWFGGHDRGCVAGASTRRRPGRAARCDDNGCGGGLDPATNGGRQAGLAGSVGLPDHYPDGATRSAGNEGVFYRRGGGEL